MELPSYEWTELLELIRISLDNTEKGVCDRTELYEASVFITSGSEQLPFTAAEIDQS